MNDKTSGWQFEEEQNVYSLKSFSQSYVLTKEKIHFTVE